MFGKWWGSIFVFVCKQMLSVGFDFISHDSHVLVLQSFLFHFFNVQMIRKSREPIIQTQLQPFSTKQHMCPTIVVLAVHDSSLFALQLFEPKLWSSLFNYRTCLASWLACGRPCFACCCRWPVDGLGAPLSGSMAWGGGSTSPLATGLRWMGMENWFGRRIWTGLKTMGMTCLEIGCQPHHPHHQSEPHQPLQEQGSALETSGWPAKGPGFLQLMSRMTLGMVVGLQALSHPGHQHHPGPEGIKATMKKSWKLWRT